MSTVNVSVLVVDADARLREALIDTLRAAGMPALAAADADEALRLLETEDVAFVISDVQMPGTNGYQLLTSIKRLRPDLPVILMTAYSTMAQAVAAMHDGATAYTRTPLHAQGLIRL